MSQFATTETREDPEPIEEVSLNETYEEVDVVGAEEEEGCHCYNTHVDLTEEQDLVFIVLNVVECSGKDEQIIIGDDLPRGLADLPRVDRETRSDQLKQNEDQAEEQTDDVQTL